MQNAASARPQPAAASKSPSRMTMANIVRGKIVKPKRVLLYGPEKTGKTTFAANAPAPIFLGAEDGTDEFDIDRLPQPTSWAEVYEGIDFLTREDHPFKTLVVDTLDWMEPLCWRHVFATKKTSDGKVATNLEDYGYGKGYSIALDYWREYLRKLEELRNRREMWIIQLAHSHVKSFKNPAGEDYDRYTLKMHEKAAGLIKEWSDVILFANLETYTTTEKNKRVKGISDGSRIIHTVRTAAWDAGSRLSLPDTLPLDWHAFYDAAQEQRPAEPESLRARIAELLEQVKNEAMRKGAQASTDKAGDDAAELARILNKLTAVVNLQETGEQS